MDEYSYDGHTYRLKKLGLADAKEVLSKLQGMGFFEDGLEALMKSTADLDSLERKLFGQNVQLLNEQGDWVPMGAKLVEAHFEGRLGAYMRLLIHMVTYNFEDFLGGGWATGLGPEVAAE